MKIKDMESSLREKYLKFILKEELNRIPELFNYNISPTTLFVHKEKESGELKLKRIYMSHKELINEEIQIEKNEKMNEYFLNLYYKIIKTFFAWLSKNSDFNKEDILNLKDSMDNAIENCGNDILFSKDNGKFDYLYFGLSKNKEEDISEEEAKEIMDSNIDNDSFVFTDYKTFDISKHNMILSNLPEQVSKKWKDYVFNILYNDKSIINFLKNSSIFDAPHA